jgi:FkbM family methyltransferase
MSYKSTINAMYQFILKIYRWVFARPRFRKVNLALFHMSLRGLGILNYKNDRVSGEKYFIEKVLPVVLKNNSPVFFDIGANIGNYSALLLNRFPSATIYAFEPHPITYNQLVELKESISSKNLRIHNVAFGNNRGELTLYDRGDYNGSTHASLHREVFSEIHKIDIGASYVVKIEQLDVFVENERLNYIDFLKIDTEGNEFAILQGASKLLQDKKIGCIQFEFNE